VRLPVQWNMRNSNASLLRRLFLDYWSILIARFSFTILPFLWSEKFDIIIPTNGGWQTLLMRLFTWVRGGKVAVVGHSGKGWDDRMNLWSFPNYFVALSKSAQRWAKRVNPFIKITFIPDGVDLLRFNHHGTKANIHLEHPIILAVSALEKSKRLHLAIQAVAKLQKGSLLILGDGPEKRTLKSLGDDLLGENRFAIEHVSYEQMAHYYRAADVFTLPSWTNEAFGMVYLEAMACNVPVVATDDELRQEIIGDAGIFVDPTDTDAYGNALQKALKTKWETKPRRQAEKFSWDTVSSKYEKLFGELML
jgi:glycosyltransferase involved in cell wall biosynthesis